MTHLHVNSTHPQTFSPDLGWLLQNDQVSDELLCSALLDEYPGPLAQMASILLQSPEDALAAVDQTLQLAIARRKKYTGNISGKAWLFAMAVSECARFTHPTVARLSSRSAGIPAQFKSARPPAHHLEDFVRMLGKRAEMTLWLNTITGFNLDEISFILKTSTAIVQAVLGEVFAKLKEHSLTCPHCTVYAGDLPALEAQLGETLKVAAPILHLDGESTTNWQRSILQRVKRQQSRQGLLSKVGRFAQAGALTALLAGAAWLTLRAYPAGLPLPQDSPVANLLPSSTPAAEENYSLPTVASPSAENTGSDPRGVIRLMRRSQRLWHSLWADVLVIQYGPPDYMALPQNETRRQAWIDQAAVSSRVISGPLTDEPSITYSVLDGQIYGQDFQSGQTFNKTSAELMPDTALQGLFIQKYMYRTGARFKLEGSEPVAGRPAWIVDLYYQGARVFRLWVDAKYGVILHRREFGGSDHQAVIMDTIVTQIFYNIPFAQGLFSPYLYKGDHYAKDFAGTPELSFTSYLPPSPANPAPPAQPTYTAPPIGFNTAAGKLVFLNLTSAGQNGSSSPAMDLFDDGYYLGKLPLGGKAILTCTRSQDGSKIAYSSVASGAPGNSALYVADLSKIQQARPVLPGGVTGGDFAFSPDGRRLAFYGCDPVGGFCGVFTINTVTGQLKRLAPMALAEYIFWKTDGQYLALVSAEDSTPTLIQKQSQNMLDKEIFALEQIWHFLILNTSSGDVVFKRAFEWSLLAAPPDSPTQSWSTSFKTPTAGLEGCIHPPA